MAWRALGTAVVSRTVVDVKAIIPALEAVYRTPVMQDPAGWLRDVADACSSLCKGLPAMAYAYHEAEVGDALQPTFVLSSGADAKLLLPLQEACRPAAFATATRATMVRSLFSSQLLTSTWAELTLALPAGTEGALWLGSHDGGALRVCLVVAGAGMQPLAAWEKAALGRWLVHVGAATRLGQRDMDIVASVDANGRFDGSKSVPPQDKKALLEAVSAREKARTADPQAAQALWTALVNGEYSLLAHQEKDGRRRYSARRNPVEPRRFTKLHMRERQVLELMVGGHNAKLAAYALGAEEGEVNSWFTKAAAVGGFADRAALIDGLRDGSVPSPFG
jgi:hypothetical protein